MLHPPPYPVLLFIRSVQQIDASCLIWTDHDPPRCIQIDTYLLHYTSSPEARAHLSAAELQYASTHVALLHQHYHSSFLSQFPSSLRNLDDKAAGGISMIDSPDMGKAVFARALRDMDGEVGVPGTDIRLAMERGAVVVARWSAVKDLVVNGFCELL